jgi:hypothetical protein
LIIKLPQSFNIYLTQINKLKTIKKKATTMTTEQVLVKLIENGFQIEQFEVDKFMCYDNGRFGLCSDEDPFIIDEDGLREIYEEYIS